MKLIHLCYIILVTEGFWELVSESIFTEVLVACNKFTILHSKYVQANLQNVSKDILLVNYSINIIYWYTLYNETFNLNVILNIVVYILET